MTAAKRDSIRIFAWLVIAAGGLMILGGIAWYVFVDTRDWTTCIWLRRNCETPSPLPVMAIGAVMAAFGVLLLAIRRPA